MCLNTCCCGHEGPKNSNSSWQGKYTPSDSAYSQCLYCPAGKSRYPPECACLNIEYDLLISASEQLYESKTDAVSEANLVICSRFNSSSCYDCQPGQYAGNGSLCENCSLGYFAAASGIY